MWRVSRALGVVGGTSDREAGPTGALERSGRPFISTGPGDACVTPCKEDDVFYAGRFRMQ